MSLLFNMLSRLVITFLPRSKHLLISWLQSPSAVILEPKKIKSDIVSTVSPSICHEVMGPDAMILVFWMLSFKPTFSLSSFTYIKRLFSFSSLSAIRMVSSAYLRLLIFLLAVLISACASSSPAFLMMYSAYKLIYSLDVLLFLFGTNLCTVIREMQIKMLRYHYISIEMANIQNTDHTRCWQGYGATGICIHTADPHYHTAETNRTLWSNYTPIKKFFEKNLAQIKVRERGK